MEIMISILALFIMLYIIIKPFILLIIEKENEKYDEANK